MTSSFLSLQAVSIILIVTLIWLIALSVFFLRSEARLKNLTKGITKKDLRDILEKIQKDAKLTSKEIKTISQNLQELQTSSQFHLQRLGFLRYNPFSDTGGDQSFCLSLLDGHDDGVVISSLHSRDQTRIYAKTIKGGKSPGYTLSKEERAVIKQALKIKT